MEDTGSKPRRHRRLGVSQVEEELRAKGNGCTKVPWAEKHSIFEELKEIQPGQSVGGMLRGRTGEGARPGPRRLSSGVLILPYKGKESHKSVLNARVCVCVPAQQSDFSIRSTGIGGCCRYHQQAMEPGLGQGSGGAEKWVDLSDT